MIYFAAVVTGVVCGVLASIPISLIIVGMPPREFATRSRAWFAAIKNG